MNKVILIGRLTANPELRYTQQRKPVASYSLAVDRPGEGADFIKCIAWDKNAEFASKHLSKGTKIAVEGRILTMYSFSASDAGRKSSTSTCMEKIFFFIQSLLTPG